MLGVPVTLTDLPAKNSFSNTSISLMQQQSLEMLRIDLPIHRVRQIGARDSSMVICELVSMNCDRSPFISSPCMEHGVWTLDCDPPRDWLYSRWSMAGTRLCFGGETEKGTGNHELNGCKGEKRTMMEWLTM